MTGRIKSSTPEEKRAWKLMRIALDELKDRKGFDNWYDSLPGYVHVEIWKAIVGKIQEELKDTPV